MLAYRMAQVFGTTIEELCCLKENKEMEDKNMKVKSKRSFIVGIIVCVLCCASLVIYCILKDKRFLISSFLLIVIVIFNFVMLFQEKTLLKNYTIVQMKETCT